MLSAVFIAVPPQVAYAVTLKSFEFSKNDNGTAIKHAWKDCGGWYSVYVSQGEGKTGSKGVHYRIRYRISGICSYTVYAKDVYFTSNNSDRRHVNIAFNDDGTLRTWGMEFKRIKGSGASTTWAW